ncbi:trypsin-like peptidase domain-containing protein [Streptomyces sp. NPDC057623]|uniref:trypsin-like peptidase domain-containing protein n=1 Tax=Streptomyces sp. NPDC057623 TaxID=3346187 RepID=UPI003680A3D4
MKRPSRSALHAVAVLFAVASVTSASTAAADDGSGPFGVTVAAATTAQTARVGALFAGGRRFCTASVVHSPRHDLVVTAAHCLDGGARDVMFVPGYRDGEAPYGAWRLGRRFLPQGWVKGRGEDSDVAFAVVADRGGEGGAGEGVEDVVGGNRFVTGMATGATAVTVTGYPNARRAPVGCTDKPTSHSRRQQRIACPGFSGGTSGSPWVNGDGEVVGVLGGHDGGGATADVSFSVVFGAEAAALYQEAERGSPSN